MTLAATPPDDGFFDTSATYRGAMNGVSDWTVFWTAYPVDQTPADVGSVVNLSGTGSPPELQITTETVWSGTVYLADAVRVYVQGGATLTVAPGTVVKGSPGSAVIVTTTGRLDAIGTSSQPILFTSDQPSGGAAAGDWGGIFLLGRAPINVAGGQSEILVPEPGGFAGAASVLAVLGTLRRRPKERRTRLRTGAANRTAAM